MSETPDEQTPDEETQEQDGPAPDSAPASEPAEEEEAAEGGELEPEPGQEQASPPEPQALSQKQMEKALDKLDREATRHRSRVEEIMGEDVAMLLPCPLCDPLTPGQIMPTPATPERFPAVREFLGDAPARELQADPQAHRCETCGGWGMVDTGSRVQGQSELPCKTCNGMGWVGERSATPYVQPVVAAQVAEANGEGQPTPITSEPPEAARLRAMGFTLIPPVGAPS